MTRHGRLLDERIQERIGELAKEMLTAPAADYAAYRQVVGRVEGLLDALKISEEIESEINGG